MLLEEPGHKYVGHLTPTSGTSKCISGSLIEHCREQDISLSKLKCIGCDGTVTNTGEKGGVIVLLEKHCRTPLHWFVCQLHANELPLRHLIKRLDGDTDSGTGFKGPIGRQLPGCELLPVVEFEAIQSETIGIDTDAYKLSNDQEYLLQIYRAVASGSCPENLSLKKPGNINHSRWLTTASRILRLYISTENPSDVLKTLVKYIMNVYVPNWFDIKCRWSVTNGAKHIFNNLFRIRPFTEDKKVKDIIEPVIQRNAYFAHPENILLGMVFDEVEETRRFAWDMIIKAKYSPRQQYRREFHIPKLEFNATEFEKIIDWDSVHITVPPLLEYLTLDELEDNSRNCLKLEEEDIKLIPCHTQAVERCVQLVTSASATTCTPESRTRKILNTLYSRDMMSSFKSKKYFNV